LFHFVFILFYSLFYFPSYFFYSSNSGSSSIDQRFNASLASVTISFKVSFPLNSGFSESTGIKPSGI